MEITNPNRSTNTETFNGIEIIVPAKKHWFVIIFLGLWLCFWSVGEFFAVKTIYTGKIGIAIGVYLFVWLSGWTYGGFFAFKSLWWIIAGKEVVSFTENDFTINKKGSFFYKATTYNTSDAKNFRILEDNLPVKHFGSKKVIKSTSKKISVLLDLIMAPILFHLPKILIGTKHILFYKSCRLKNT